MTDAKAFNLSFFRMSFFLLLATGYQVFTAPKYRVVLPFLVAARDRFPALDRALITLLAAPVGRLTFFDLLSASLSLVALVAAWGFRSRLCSGLVLALYFLGEHTFSAYLEFYVTNGAFFCLALLALSPGAHRYGARSLLRYIAGVAPLPEPDGGTRDPGLSLLRLVTPIVFFNSAVTKLVNSGLSWVTGDALRAYLYFTYLFAGNKVALRLSAFPALTAMASAAVLLFEFTAIPLCLSAKGQRLFVPIALSFHVLTWAFLDIPILRVGWIFLLPYLAYVDFFRLSSALRAVTGARAAR